MEITNVTVSTEIKYEQSDEELDSAYASTGFKVYYVRLKVPIPGGEVSYYIRTAQDINESIEASQTLNSKKRK